MKKRLFTSALILVIALTLVFIMGICTASAETVDPGFPMEGSCGESLSYTFDYLTGVLEVSGEGELTAYPWLDSAIAPHNVRKAIINEGITAIGDSAFSGMYKITSVYLPATVRSIGYDAFAHCNINSITLPQGLESIGSRAFEANDSMSIAIIPSSVVNIGADAFNTGNTDLILSVTAGSAGLAYAKNNMHSYVIDGVGHLYVPFDENTMGVCGASATYDFNYDTNTLEISGIGELSNTKWTEFKPARQNIKHVVITDGIEAIGENVFRKMNIESLELPNTVRTIGYSAFAHDSLTNLNLPEGVEEIGAFAFTDNHYLTAVSLPSTVRSIGYCAFQNSNLQNLVLPNGLETIADAAFSCNYELTSVTIPGSVISIGEDAFLNYNPDLVLTVEEDSTGLQYAIDNCIAYRIGESGETYIPFGQDMEGNCGSEARYFYDHENRTLEITGIGEISSEPLWQNAEIARNNITSIVIGEGITTVGECAFNNMREVSSVVLPSTIREIAYSAFANCNLSQLTLPEGLTTIGGDAFARNANISSVKIPSSVSHIGPYAFPWHSQDLVLTVTKYSVGWEYAIDNLIPYRIGDSGQIIRPGVPEPPYVPILPVFPRGDEDITVRVRCAFGKVSDEGIVEVPVYLESNPGITLLKLDLEYDKNVMELVGVENGEIFPDSALENSQTGVNSLFFEDALSMTDYTNTGLLATLKFRVLTDETGKYTVNLKMSEDNAANANLETLKVGVYGGQVILNDYLFGDINNDDEIDNIDVLAFRYYMAGYQDYQEIMLGAADVNYDGDVNVLDYAILARHVAGWRGYEELPYGVDWENIVDRNGPYGFPNKTVTIICPYAISGGTGTMCNIMAEFLSNRWGVPVNVVEKSGGSGSVGTAEMAFAEPDGYTIMVTAYGAMCLWPNSVGTDYRFEDIKPIAQISESYTILSTSATHGKYQTWDEFCAAAMAAPGTLTVSSSGTFGPHHVAIEQLSIALTGHTGLFLYMPESGGAAACTAVLGGHYDAVAGLASEQSKYYGASVDALVPLLQLTDKKACETDAFATSKEVPTCGDLGINATGGTFYMVCCQKDVPEEIVNFLEQELAICMSDPTVIAKFEASDNPVVFLNRADATAKYAREYEAAREVAQALM